jgi:hypothetical protein
MRTALRFASAFSWFNLFFWGIPLLMDLLRALGQFNVPMLVFLVLFVSIPLNSYAALQLHRSIRNPNVKLSHHTPAGIRFVGLIALFFGALFVLAGGIILKAAPQLAQFIRENKYEQEMLGSLTVDQLRLLGGFFGVLGLIAVVNVILNFRLLRWYYLVKQSDAP